MDDARDRDWDPERLGRNVWGRMHQLLWLHRVRCHAQSRILCAGVDGPVRVSGHLLQRRGVFVHHEQFLEQQQHVHLDGEQHDAKGAGDGGSQPEQQLSRLNFPR